MELAADQAPGEQRRTILLVEDDVLLRIALADHLRSNGYHVIEAGTVIEAATVLSSGPTVHLVFSDVDLPGGSGGLSLAVWIGTHYPDVPVILTSGVHIVVPARAGRGQIPFIAKPYDFDAVAASIGAAIADRSTS